jgi:predicted nucleic acid-binding Zn ribbon protein
LIVAFLVGKRHMNPSHTPPATFLDTRSLAGDTPVPAAVKRACLICGRSLHGRRPETISCSGRCRAALARQRRRDDLVTRGRRVEVALKEAAEALGSFRELAVLDATLELRSISIRRT